MDVDELKNLLFEMLEGNGELFSDLSLDDETDTNLSNLLMGKGLLSLLVL